MGLQNGDEIKLNCDPRGTPLVTSYSESAIDIVTSMHKMCQTFFTMNV